MKIMGRILVCFILFSALSVGNSSASMLDPKAMGARASAMGGATAAIDDPLSAFYLNPSCLTEIEGTYLVAGGGVADIRLRYKSTEAITQGYSEQNSFDSYVPYFGFATDSFDPIVIGIGMYSTLGAGYEFEKDPAHGVNGDLAFQAGVLFLSPAIAYKISPKLAIGIELNIGYGKSEINQPQLGTNQYLEIDADGYGYGTTIGLLYRPTPLLNLGLSWRSQMHVSQDGKLRSGITKTDLELDMYNPQMIVVGMGYQFSPRLLLCMTIKWSDWSYFDRSKLKFNGVESPFARDSRDGWRFSFAGEYQVNDVLTLRAGYLYDLYSIQEEWISPLLMDATFHDLSAGATLKVSKWEISLFSGYDIIRSRTVNNSAVGYSGRYRGDVFPFVAIDFLYHF